MPKYDLVAIGGATVDHLNVVEHFPEKDQKIVPLWSSLQGGGQAATAVAAAAKLGLKTAMVGTVGEGPIGEFAMETLKKEGVDTSLMVQQKGKAPALSSIIIEDKIGSRTIVADRGQVKNLPLNEEMYEAIKNCKVVHSDAHFPEENMELIKFARKNGIPVCIDAEPHTPNHREFAKLADIFIVSRRFVENQFGHDYERALKEYINNGAKIAVVTLGKYGAIGVQKEDMEIYSVPEYVVEPVVDTTGAGDVFHGAFLYAWLQKWDFKKIMKFSNVCASLKCLKIGGRLGMPTLAEALKALEGWKF
ncbi:carbohydrate kinase family protein [Candidatus Peregrinibacteria bacterium]|nr:carbohydrate kinase family protein [Candidatus Peregrinibacteria bacterium]